MAWEAPHDTSEFMVIEFFESESFKLSDIRDLVLDRWQDIKPEDFLFLKVDIILHNTSKCYSGCCPPDYSKYLRIWRPT